MLFGHKYTNNDNRLSLVLLGGFLGSGKTTLLNLALQQPQVGLLINDLGNTAPDLEFMRGKVRMLLGGCACCDKRNELIALLRNICSKRHESSDGTSQLIIEMSGLADPANVLAAIDSDAVLTANVRIDEVAVTIDAARGLGDLIHEPLARRQIQQCDKVIITKIDLASNKQLETITATASALNPNATLIATSFGKPQPVPAINPVAAIDIAALSNNDNTGSVEAIWIPFAKQIDWSVFALWFGSVVYAHRHDILRVKGLLRSSQGLIIIHAARGVIGVPTVLADQHTESENLGLLFLMRNLDKEQLLKSWQRHVLSVNSTHS